MTCDESEALLHALIDGELDAGHSREVEAHAAACVRCAAQLAAYRELHKLLNKAELRHAAPLSLRASIEKTVPLPAAQTNRRAVLKGFISGGVVSAAAAASFALVMIREDRDSRIVGEAISAHLRSLQGEHLTDVLSTDQHTVKPWFNGKLDVAPPVIDLTAQGFTLIGGRLDYIDAKPVAAIVYRRRVHVINLFVAQGVGTLLAARKIETVQGFNVLRWSDQGLNLMAVSDINREELEEFGAKFEQASRAARAG